MMSPLAFHVERAQEWLLGTCTGDFSGFVLGKELGIETVEARDQVLADLMSLGLIEPVRGKHGQYAKVNNDCRRINWRDAKEAWYPLLLPFGLHKMCGVRPKTSLSSRARPTRGRRSSRFKSPTTTWRSMEGSTPRRSISIPRWAPTSYGPAC